VIVGEAKAAKVDCNVSTYPLTENGALCDTAGTQAYFSALFRHVQWEDGQRISLLGIGEKGTAQEGVFRERKIVAPAFIGSAHAHLKRWAEHHVAAFCVPAVLHSTAEERGDVTFDKIAALTAIVLDLDSGKITEAAKYAIDRLGTPTVTIASGGKTADGEIKRHLYWRLNEPCYDVEVVADLRKQLAAKVGGDQSFGRATQVIRVPGSVHAKNGIANRCTILEKNELDYSLDDLAEIIINMERMPSLPEPAVDTGSLWVDGMMDFTPRRDTAIAAMHRDIHEGGSDRTRWSEFSKVAGFHIREFREGRLTLKEANHTTKGWMLTRMIPPWPEARFQQEFDALIRKDVAAHAGGPGNSELRASVRNGSVVGWEQLREKSQKSQAQPAPIQKSTDAWQAPIPLQGVDAPSEQYPIEALPTVIREAVIEYQRYGQQPLALVGCAALANLSLAAQGRANVARDPVLTGPISLNFLVVAESGERKTTVDKAFGAACRRWEEEKKQASQPELENFRSLIAIHESKLEGLKKGLAKAASLGNESAIFEAKICALEAERPKPPKIVRLSYEDSTIEAIARDIAIGWPSASIWSDEGGIVVGGHSFSDEKATYAFAMLNRLWDGNNIPARGRVANPTDEIRGRRMTVSLAMQGAVLNQLCGTSKGASRGTGFLARFLIAEPESTMGTRLYKKPPLNMPAMEAFHSMIRSQLVAGIMFIDERYEIDPPTLQFDAASAAAWVDYYNRVEQELRSDGEFEDVKDFASKSADNVARLAALFHLAEGGAPDGRIGEGHVLGAVRVVGWHLGQAQRMTHSQVSPEFADAICLLRWIFDRDGKVMSNTVLNKGPASLRHKPRRDAAVAILAEHNLARRVKDHTGEYLEINPAAARP
jgi:hypothetical protein